MCDVKSMAFFRPWKGEVVATTNVNDDDKTIKRETKNGVSQNSVKRRDSDEEDTDSIDSSWSATSEIESYQRRSNLRRELQRERVTRRRSLGSSCSTGSCDDPSAIRNLDPFSNFEIAADKANEQNGRTNDETSMNNEGCCNGSNPSSEISSTASCNSPRSAFTPTSYGLVYPNLDYPSPLIFDSFPPNWSPGHTDQMNLFYGLAAMPIGSYGSCMEEAVKYIHQQDIAAKQMKKLRPKKFRCLHCDVAFSNNGQLKGHIRIHTGERPFKCEIDGCNKAFTRNEELTRHRKIHTGLKPHSCEICGKSFGRKDHLKKHQRTHQNRGIPAHFGATMFGFIEHPAHFQTLPSGRPVPPYHYPA